MEVRVCEEDQVRPGAVQTAQLGHDAKGRPIQAVVLRDGRGRLVAYRNLCRHLPVPLDGGTGELLSDDRRHLVCGTHGATYRIHDGYCVDGPCEGMFLFALDVRVEDGGVYVSLPAGER